MRTEIHEDGFRYCVPISSVDEELLKTITEKILREMVQNSLPAKKYVETQVGILKEDGSYVCSMYWENEEGNRERLASSAYLTLSVNDYRLTWNNNINLAAKIIFFSKNMLNKDTEDESGSELE